MARHPAVCGCEWRSGIHLECLKGLIYVEKLMCSDLLLYVPSSPQVVSFHLCRPLLSGVILSFVLPASALAFLTDHEVVSVAPLVGRSGRSCRSN